MVGAGCYSTTRQCRICEQTHAGLGTSFDSTCEQCGWHFNISSPFFWAFLCWSGMTFPRLAIISTSFWALGLWHCVIRFGGLQWDISIPALLCRGDSISLGAKGYLVCLQGYIQGSGCSIHKLFSNFFFRLGLLLCDLFASSTNFKFLSGLVGTGIL